VFLIVVVIAARRDDRPAHVRGGLLSCLVVTTDGILGYRLLVVANTLSFLVAGALLLIRARRAAEKA
jgi:hypothetical protein